MEYRIMVYNVTKKFQREYVKNESALSRTLSFFPLKKHKREFEALRNVSFSVKPGENLGIIGKNGSGKSTLLKTIAGIYECDEGSIEIKGNVVYLTGFGQGLKKRLTMRENIYLVGSLMGLSKNEIKDRFDEIVEFSELEDYLDTKVYQFSSGMVNRLGFSITIYCVSHKNPDIILIDEAFGGGADITFKNKALDKMEELIKGGASIILVSHDLALIKKYCDRALWIDYGGVAKEGDPEEVIRNYLKPDTFEIISDRYKFIYFPLPKVACSSLKTVFANLMEIKPEKDIHKTNFLQVNRIDIKKYPNYFKFCFVRNPWDRILSCYLNKIGKDPNVNNEWFRNGVHREFVRMYGDDIFRGGMSFEEFVNAIGKISDSQANEHFRSQYISLTDSNGNLIPDFIGKFENLEQDFEKICEKINVGPIKLPHLMKTDHRDYKNYYNMRTKEIVAKRFKEDIELFSYKF